MARTTKELKMSIDPEFDFVLEEQGQTSINLRKVSWNDRPYKIDIRKWSYQDPGKEQALKGITLSDDGASALALALVQSGYGDTNTLVQLVSSRKDYGKVPIKKDVELPKEDEIEKGAPYFDPNIFFVVK